MLFLKMVCLTVAFADSVVNDNIVNDNIVNDNIVNDIIVNDIAVKDTIVKDTTSTDGVAAVTEIDLEFRLKSLDRHLVEVLALDRLRQLMIEDNQVLHTAPCQHLPALPSRTESKDNLSGDEEPIALLSFFDELNPESEDVVPMLRNSLAVGTRYAHD
jgi:hypothetical protein